MKARVSPWDLVGRGDGVDVEGKGGGRRIHTARYSVCFCVSGIVYLVFSSPRCEMLYRSGFDGRWPLARWFRSGSNSRREFVCGGRVVVLDSRLFWKCCSLIVLGFGSWLVEEVAKTWSSCSEVFGDAGK